MGQYRYVVLGLKLMARQSRVGWRFVVMHEAVLTAPLVWTFSPNIFSQSSYEPGVVLLTQVLDSMGVILVSNSLAAKQNDMILNFGRGGNGLSLLGECCFVSGS
jgi:hypothetical protein